MFHKSEILLDFYFPEMYGIYTIYAVTMGICVQGIDNIVHKLFVHYNVQRQ